jgi:hypothetical protein
MALTLSIWKLRSSRRYARPHENQEHWLVGLQVFPWLLTHWTRVMFSLQNICTWLFTLPSVLFSHISLHYPSFISLDIIFLMKSSLSTLFTTVIHPPPCALQSCHPLTPNTECNFLTFITGCRWFLLPQVEHKLHHMEICLAPLRSGIE